MKAKALAVAMGISLSFPVSAINPKILDRQENIREYCNHALPNFALEVAMMAEGGVDYNLIEKRLMVAMESQSDQIRKSFKVMLRSIYEHPAPPQEVANLVSERCWEGRGTTES